MAIISSSLVGISSTWTLESGGGGTPPLPPVVFADIGSYAAAMGGVDAIVFTAGVGENDAAARMAIASGLEFMGVKKYGMEGNLVAGANIAGFLKVADAMLAQGIV